MLGGREYNEKICGLMSDSPFFTSSDGFDSFEQKLGDELRGERATLGKSLLDVQRELHVKAAYISAIENCDVSVFPNASFVSGYVRSYARYLGLDPEETFARFCVEARFQSTSSELGMKKTPKNKRNAQPVTDPQAWVPSMPGYGVDGTRSGAQASATLVAAGPALVLAAVVVVLGYAAWFVMQDIQRVEFAPVEDNPMVAFEPEGLGASLSDGSDGFSASSIALAADPSILYNKRELEVPIVQPRDGPIFAINTEASTVDLPVSEVTVEQIVVEGSPLISETPHIPSISLVAQQEAWVRVYEENGTIIFEQILAAGEQYTLPNGAPAAYLRAGNATAVFVMVDDAAYGPISSTDAVVRDISLMAAAITNDMNEVSNPSIALQVAAEAWRKTNTASLSD